VDDTTKRSLTPEEKKELTNALHRHFCEAECGKVFMSKQDFQDGVIKTQNKIIWCFVGTILSCALVGWYVRGGFDSVYLESKLMAQSCVKINSNVEEYLKTQHVMDSRVSRLENKMDSK